MTGSPSEAPGTATLDAPPPPPPPPPASGTVFTAPSTPPPVSAPRPKRRRRRTGGLLGLVIAGAVAFGATGGSDKLSGLPVIGRDADDVYDQLRDAGMLIGPGRPASSEYDDLVDNNACQSSRTFVRTNTDMGWGIICVDPPRAAYRRMSRVFDGVPMVAGPLFVDDGGGEVLIFGFGWPTNASKQMYKSIGAENGTYLIEM